MNDTSESYECDVELVQILRGSRTADRLNEEARHRGGELHIDIDELLCYHAGGLSDERRDTIQWHLAACRDCADLLLEIDRSEASLKSALTAGVPEPREGVADLRVEARLKNLMAAARKGGDSPAKKKAWRSGRSQLAVAALFVLALTISLTMPGLLRRGAQGPAPTALPGTSTDLAVHEIGFKPRRSAAERSAGDHSEAGGTEIRRTDFESFTILAFRVSNYDPEAKLEVVLQSADPAQSPLGFQIPCGQDRERFALGLSRKSLPAGRYTLRAVLVQSHGERQELPAQEVLVSDEPGSD